MWSNQFSESCNQKEKEEPLPLPSIPRTTAGVAELQTELAAANNRVSELQDQVSKAEKTAEDAEHESER